MINESSDEQKTTLKISGESQQLSLEKQKYIQKYWSEWPGRITHLVPPALMQFVSYSKVMPSSGKEHNNELCSVFFFYLFSNTENDLIEMW